VNVALTNSGVGSLPPGVSFTGGMDMVTVQFNASTPGTTTLTAPPPAGFSTPAGSANTLVVTVFPPDGVETTDAAVGYKLQTPGQVRLSQGVAPADLTVTLVSNDPSKVLLSKTAAGAGAASITMTMLAGHNATPEFYIHGMANSGIVTYTATVPGIGSDTGNVTLTPSGFVIAGPSGFGVNFTTGFAQNINVYPARLDASANFAEVQALAGGLSADISVTSSNTAVGTIATSPVTIAGGDDLAITLFNPVGSGSTTLTATGPADFATPAQYRTLNATVIQQNLLLCSGVVVGKNLQQICTVQAAAPAGTGGLPVTVTSNHPSLLKVAATGTVAGSNSINVTIPEGTFTTTFYLQSLSDSGAATFTVTAPGYPARTETVTLAPSGVVITGIFGFTPWPHQTLLAAGPSQLTVYAAVLDPSTLNPQPQELAGGTSLAVSLTNSDPAVGTVQTPVTITGGNDRVTATFTPLTVNMTIVSVTQPPQFSQPSQYTSLVVQVLP